MLLCGTVSVVSSPCDDFAQEFFTYKYDYRAPLIYLWYDDTDLE